MHPAWGWGLRAAPRCTHRAPCQGRALRLRPRLPLLPRLPRHVPAQPAAPAPPALAGGPAVGLSGAGIAPADPPGPARGHRGGQGDGDCSPLPPSHSHPAFLGCSWADVAARAALPPAHPGASPRRVTPGRWWQCWLRSLGAAGSNNSLRQRVFVRERGSAHVMPADRCLVVAQLYCAQPGAELVTSGPAVPGVGGTWAD